MTTLPPMTEKQLQDHVVHAAKTFGWRCYHTWMSARSDPGFPDLLLLRDGQMIVAELKRDGADPSPAQEAWLNAFEDLAFAIPAPWHTRVSVYLWHPADWRDGTIERALR